MADAGRPLTSGRAGRRHRPRRAVGAGVGPQPGAPAGSSSFDDDGVDVLALARGGRRARRRPTTRLRHGHVRPASRRRWSLLERLPDSFRTGVGHDYDAHGPDGAAGIERSFAPWYRHFLVPVALPAARRRRRPARGRGAPPPTSAAAPAWPCSLMAAAFPASRRSTATTSPQHALDRAEQRRADEGVGQRAVPRRPHGPAPADGTARPRHDVRLHPRHDPPAGDDGARSARRSPTTGPGCSSTSRRATRSPRTWPRTRWRR